MKNYQIFLLSFLISLATILSYADNKKTLLIFGAKWCNFCQVAKQDMNNDKDLSEVVKNYSIIDLDYDTDKDMIDGYDVKTLPTFIIYQNGKEIKRLAGYRGSKQLLRFLK